jgi:hypothetical protein
MDYPLSQISQEMSDLWQRAGKRPTHLHVTPALFDLLLHSLQPAISYGIKQGSPIEILGMRVVVESMPENVRSEFFMTAPL